jgi:HK97 family phage prohead protease
MTTKTKTRRPEVKGPARLTRVVVPVSFKAASSSDTKDARTFEGLAAVWDLDLGGDIIHKGAFKTTLADWKKSSEALPLLNSHDHFDIMSALGQLLEAKETDQGLWTKWEVIDGPEGDAVLQRLRPSTRTGRPLVGKMSIGFEPVKFDFEQPEGTTSFWDQIRHLKAVNLKEVSLVLFPMAPGASIDASTVKSFIASIEATDPKKLTPEMRVKMRQLSGKIGNLLSNFKKEVPPDDEVSDEPDAEDELPPDETEVDTDEPEDEEEEDSSTEGSGNTEGEETETEGDPVVEGEGEKAVIYPYQEALTQRLQKTLLKNKTSSVLAKD